LTKLCNGGVTGRYRLGVTKRPVPIP